MFRENSGKIFFAEKKNKIIALSILMSSVFVIYVYKLYSMQILHGISYQTQAERISQRTKKITAQRGEIYDRGATVPMVLNIDSFAVDLIPGEIPSESKNTVLSKLAHILEIKREKINKICPSACYNSFKPIEIKANVPYEIITKLAEQIDELPGVSWRSKPIRSYVDTGSLSHVIGYVGDITKDELQVNYNKGYSQSSIIGKAGVEKQYEELLRGKDGYESRTVDVKGRYMTDEASIMPPEMGKNIVLTIDTNLQNFAEKALGERMGAIVVLKPTTGEILAMVSYPYYDPNIFNQEGGNNLYNKLLQDPNTPLLNRAVAASYPPASTFKVIMTTALLEEKAIDPAKKIECKGEMFFGDRVFRCHIRKPGHGYLNLEEALGESCDIYYWVIGRENLGVNKIVDYAELFGLGQKTGIDLPTETAGLVPTPQWKERRNHEKWLGGDTLNMSIGQGNTLATPLQVANMCAMVINSGTIYKPHLLKEVRDPTNETIISTVKPEILYKRNISLETFETVRRYMRYVISDGGSRYPFKPNIIKVAGKSGTAEVGSKDHWHSWFVAYGPYDAPPEDTIVVATIVEASNEWEWWAPYATSLVMQGYFANQSFEEAVDALGLRYRIKPRGRVE